MRISQENVHRRGPQGNQPPPPQRAQTPFGLGLPKSLRILKRSHFQSISRHSKRFIGQSVVIQYRAGESPKLGVTASRKFGKAIMRNRFKRLAREAFRSLAPLFPPFEIVLLPKKGISTFSLDGIAHDLKTFMLEHAQSSATKSR